MIQSLSLLAFFCFRNAGMDLEGYGFLRFIDILELSLEPSAPDCSKPQLLGLCWRKVGKVFFDLDRDLNMLLLLLLFDLILLEVDAMEELFEEAEIRFSCL